MSEISITEQEINFAGALSFACSIPGIFICFLVLLCYGVLACYKVGRDQLDRVSIRLLLLSTIFNVLYGIAYAATPVRPGPGCEIAPFFFGMTLCFTTFFTTCIAINLQLVVVHGVNAKRFEKYYVIGSILLGLILTVPTMATNHFGWDNGSASCWYKSTDSQSRLRWIIGTDAFWIALAATLEAICSVVVLTFIYRTTRFMKGIVNVTEKSNPKHSRSVASAALQDPRYRQIILRIALYPIISLLINFLTVGLDLKGAIQGLNTPTDFRLFVADLILYAIRPLVYGLLAATDPAFVSAIQAVRKEYSVEKSRRGTRADVEFGSVSAAETSGTSFLFELQTNEAQGFSPSTTVGVQPMISEFRRQL